MTAVHSIFRSSLFLLHTNRSCSVVTIVQSGKTDGTKTEKALIGDRLMLVFGPTTGLIPFGDLGHLGTMLDNVLIQCLRLDYLISDFFKRKTVFT